MTSRNAGRRQVRSTDARIAGLEVVDRYTLRIRLNQPDYNFGYLLAMPATGAHAREVIEAYEDSNAHPVGTGPYVLKKWVRGSKITLEANPDYPHQAWNFQPSSEVYDKQLIAEMKGKTIPQIGVIEIQWLLPERYVRQAVCRCRQASGLTRAQYPVRPNVLSDGDRCRVATWGPPTA